MEKIGQTHINDPLATLKNITSNLDALAPKIEEVEWAIFDRILENTDFTKSKNILESFKIFYTQLWTHVIFRLEADLHSAQKQEGKLIIQSDEWRRKCEKLEEENKSLRESLQEKSNL